MLGYPFLWAISLFEELNYGLSGQTDTAQGENDVTNDLPTTDPRALVK